MTSITENMCAGSIHEGGFLKSLYRKGFTPAKCILELVANSLDAHDKLAIHREFDKKLVFHVGPNNIRMIDNGNGMNRESAKDMFAMHRENHEGDTSRGVSGIGSKPALSILSERTEVHIFTRTPSGEYLHIVVPWDIIHREGKYSGMIQISLMSDDTQQEFIQERREFSMLSAEEAHGTTIVFKVNDSLKNAIETNFKDIRDDNNPLDRIGVVFGRDNVEFLYKHFEEFEKQTLEKYNYFDGIDTGFYRGKLTENIEVFTGVNKPSRFIWKNDGRDLEIKAFGPGFKKEPEESSTNMNGYRSAGTFTVRVALRNDENIFNREHPRVPTTASQDNIGTYNSKHLGADCSEFLGSYKLVRNEQLIGLIPPPDTKISSARANCKAAVEGILVQCEISYNPRSNQDNILDHIMNIQENKNQYDGKSVVKNLTRLIHAIKKKKFAEIWSYFETASTVVPVLPPLPAEEDADSVSEGLVDSDSVESLDVRRRHVEEPVVAPTPAPAAQATNIIDFLRNVENTQNAEESALSSLSETPLHEESVELEENVDNYIIPAASPAPASIIPVNVRQHRRGLVHGRELIQELQRVLQIVDANTEYTDDTSIGIFNSLMNY